MQKVTKIGKTGQVISDTTLLDALIQGIEMCLVARVGVLGAKGRRNVEDQKSGAPRKKEAPTNADIGLAHEKGIKSKNLPRRSWLEDPLRDHLPEHFAKLGKNALQKMLEARYVQAYAQLGIVGEVIIQKGFETGGYGKWKPLSEATIRAKGSSAILIHTAQLRRSVTSQVVKK